MESEIKKIVPKDGLPIWMKWIELEGNNVKVAREDGTLIIATSNFKSASFYREGLANGEFILYEDWLKQPTQEKKAPEFKKVTEEPAKVEPPAAVTEVLEQRGQTYGDREQGMAANGRIWAGMLSSYFGMKLPDIPPHLVALMMAAVKLSRASAPTPYHEDNFTDFHGYIKIANDVAKSTNNGK